MMLILAVITGLNIFLYMAIPKGFFPTQDSGRLETAACAPTSRSRPSRWAARYSEAQLVAILMKDPAVSTVVAFTGGGRPGGGYFLSGSGT